MPANISDLTFKHAVRVWTRRHSGDWTDEDERALSLWLNAAAENRAAYEKVARLWASAGKLERSWLDSVVPRRMLIRRRIAVGCAAVLLIAVVVPTWLRMDHWWNGVPAHWVAPKGQSRALVLEDGTRVLLDADSDLIVKLGAYARRVSLVRGEALFTVAHDSSHPFEIDIGPGRVVDLGTRIDVEKLPDAVHIAVIEGRVGVRTPHGEMVLGAGRGGGYDAAGTLLPVKRVDAAATLSADGERHFDSESLATIVARLERYHSVSFVFADPLLQELRVSGTFRVNDLPLFLRTLSAVLPVEARWVGPQRVEFARRQHSPADTGE